MVLLAKLRSFIKGQHAYNATANPGDYANCDPENTNLYSDNAWKVTKMETNHMLGHIPESLAAVLADLRRRRLIESVTCKITGYRQPAIGGVWVQGGGIVLPCTYKIYGAETHRNVVRTMITNAQYDINDVQ